MPLTPTARAAAAALLGRRGPAIGKPDPRCGRYCCARPDHVRYLRGIAEDIESKNLVRSIMRPFPADAEGRILLCNMAGGMLYASALEVARMFSGHRNRANRARIRRSARGHATVNTALNTIVGDPDWRDAAQRAAAGSKAEIAAFLRGLAADLERLAGRRH